MNLNFPFGFPRTAKLRAAREAGASLPLMLRNPFAHPLSIVDTSAPAANRALPARGIERCETVTPVADGDEAFAPVLLDQTEPVALLAAPVQESDPVTDAVESVDRIDPVALVVGENQPVAAEPVDQLETLLLLEPAIEESEPVDEPVESPDRMEEFAPAAAAVAESEPATGAVEPLDEIEQFALAFAAASEAEPPADEAGDQYEPLTFRDVALEQSVPVLGTAQPVDQIEPPALQDTELEECEQVSDIVAFVAGFEQIMAEAIAAAGQADVNVVAAIDVGEPVATASQPVKEIEPVAVEAAEVAEKPPVAQPALKADNVAEESAQPATASAAVANPAAPGLISRGWAWIKKNQQIAAAKKLRVSETVALGDKRFVAVVHIEGQRYLIGGGTAGVSLLAQLGEPGANVLQPEAQRGSLAE